MKKNYGFTLIELMIVVAIIAIIAAIAIPNLLRSRMQTNESAAISNLRAINGAQTAFHSANSRYATNFDELTTATPPFLDGDWGLVKSGYNFVMAGEANAYTANANAETYGTTGNRGFFTDQSGVIRFAIGANAAATDDPIGTVVN
jgi:prepilin-type N-terminal cleavage/methylation domain-containing protein